MQPDRAGGEMVDLLFEVAGERLPADYRWGLWLALRAELPWLDATPGAGIIGLRTGGVHGGVALLPRRCRLALRVPGRRVDDARGLSGRRLRISDDAILVGAPHERPLRPASTLYSDLVVPGDGGAGEADFVEALGAELRRIGAACRWICGGARQWQAGEQRIVGYAVALHDCAPTDAMRVLSLGVGVQRGPGCGIFVEHKRIQDLD